MKAINRHRYALERELAPAVEEEWAEKLILELRLTGVSGKRIGDALSEVNSHCADSGQNAHDAFGDPVEYARSLKLPPDLSTGAFRAAAPLAVQLAGSAAVLDGLRSINSGGPVLFSLGEAVVVALVLGALILLTTQLEWLLRAFVRRPIAAIVVHSMLLVAMLVALVSLDDVTLAQFPAWPTFAAGTTVLLFGVAGQLSDLRRKRGGVEDPVTSPLKRTTERKPLRSRLASSAVFWIIPIYTAVFATLALLPA
ncbi:hypothetical protein BJ994_003214 [Arthrobacter pigmenti]|uniref:Uncharacterized protein n=1 Tax=Arthrobacter pigmenti TaxID=271432 RepID=A0A846RL83_9MICC|nr:hypothetical protein [Arthrobacter pigmenti]NJC24138.1 hypothetical protein [Arthrobacter pigmenti]